MAGTFGGAELLAGTLVSNGITAFSFGMPIADCRLPIPYYDI